jgi:hypothetical protein
MNDVSESSSRGAVLLALESIGKMVNIEKLPVSAERSIKANRNRTGLYRKARSRHADIYKLLIR